MNGPKIAGTLLSLALVAIPATPSLAFCHWFGRCKTQPTTTFYAPVATVAPAPTVVNYMPQTAYRTVMVNRPVTTMVAEPACDPCGRSTTVMRPVTTFVAQPQLVPYTTFRPVVMAAPVTVNFAPAPVAAPACCGATAAPAPVTTYSPAPVAMPAPAPAPSCCGGAATPTPSLSSYAPSPLSTTVVPSTTPGTITSSTVTPSLAPTTGSTLQSLQPTPDPSISAQPSGVLEHPTTPPAGSQPGQTFAPNGNGSGTTTPPESQPQSRVLLPPSAGAASSFNQPPRGLDPEESDRTTAIPLGRSYEVRQASLVVPNRPAPRPAPADDGWRAVAE